jgi:hypothetical protein
MQDFIDDSQVRRLTADSDGTSSGFTFPVFIHKVQLHGGTDDATDVKLHAAVSITGDAKVHIKSAAEVVVSEDFAPPVRFQKGMSVDITGSGAIAYIYYTRA